METRKLGRYLKFLASVCSRGRLGSAVSLVAEIYPLQGIGKFGGDLGKWETERCDKTPGNAVTRADAKISSHRKLPRASVCFRGRVVAVVSLASELYQIYDIGKFGFFIENGGAERHQEHLKTREPGGS